MLQKRVPEHDEDWIITRPYISIIGEPINPAIIATKIIKLEAPEIKIEHCEIKQSTITIKRSANISLCQIILCEINVCQWTDDVLHVVLCNNFINRSRITAMHTSQVFVEDNTFNYCTTEALDDSIIILYNNVLKGEISSDEARSDHKLL
jgi:hypothetical protein